MIFNQGDQNSGTLLDGYKLIVKEADKNLGLTLLDRSRYHNQVIKLLTSDNYELSNPNQEKIGNDVKGVLRPLPKTEISVRKVEHLEFSVPKFYILPKVCKHPVSSRPNVAHFNWLTTDVSIWLHKKLWKLVFEIE